MTASLAAVGALVLNAPPAYATGIGERRVVVLKDGSRIELNTDTKVVVRVRGTRREVTLVRGEALFQVTKAEQPFVVVAPQSTLTAQDSELSVRLSDDNAIVSVSRGAVEVDPNNAAAVRLVATVDAVANDSWVRTRARSAEQIRRAQAWREGGVWLDGRSLAETVEEFNRYNERKLVLEDPSIAGLRLGGYFRTDDLGGFVSALTKAFPVVVEARENSYALARRS